MEIGIDISAIIYGRGVSNYIANLTRELLVNEKNDRFYLYANAGRQAAKLRRVLRQWPEMKKANKIVIDNLPMRVHEFFWRHGWGAVRNKIGRVDVFHSWDWLQPPDQDLPLVSTIHDLAILKYPQTAHPKITAFHRRSWKILQTKQAEIITPSHAVRKDVLQLLSWPPERVHVVYEALNFSLQQAVERLTDQDYQRIKSRLRLDRPFVLFVGTREPRKNLARLIEAMEKLSKDYRLLIAGDRGWDDSDQVFHYDWLRFLGRVSDAELAVLYSEAELLAFPSLDEGFGLPILEAFYFGTPVVTSRIGAMREVAGNAAELVDPFSVAGIRRGLIKILNENKKEQRQRLQKMIIRRQLFSWSQAARETRQVYHLAYQNQQK